MNVARTIRLQLGGTNRVGLRFCGDWVDTRWTLGGQTKVAKLARGESVFKGAPLSSFIIKDKYKPMDRTSIYCIHRVIFGVTVKLIF